MDFGDDDKEFLARWQYLKIREKIESAAAARCDVLRSQIAHLEGARASGRLNAGGMAAMFEQLSNTYSGIVDAPTEEGGVDNYAESVLTLTAGKRNESKLWSTSFNKENIMKLDCVKTFLRESELARELHFPEGRDNEVLPVRPSTLPLPPTPDCATPSKPPASRQPLFKPQISQHATQCADQAPKAPSGGRQPPSPDNESRWMAKQRADSQLFGGRDGLSRKAMAGTCTTTLTHTPAPKLYAQFASDKAAPSYKKPLKRQCQELDEEEEEDFQTPPPGRAFRTAGEQLAINNQKKYAGGRGGVSGGQGHPGAGGAGATPAYGTQKRSLGTRRGLNSKFIPPIIREDNDDGGSLPRKVGRHRSEPEEEVHERLRNIEPKMIELINNEIMDHGPEVMWTDIAGLQFAKKTINEIVVWPMLRPDIFVGLRGPPKGLLLFGPPGTGKTLIGKCIASQSKSTFFSISASSLTSKWVGEGEKMVRALFAVASVSQPSVIFIDEIDSLLSQRTDGENEGSRRIKTEFLVQLDGAGTGSEDRILVVGATNRPQEIDEAARRRFVKRLYIPLPEAPARRQIVVNLMGSPANSLTEAQIDTIAANTQGYSGADMSNLCREAALGPIRSVPFEEIESIAADQVRPIENKDFVEALEHVRPSVSEKDLDTYLEWNQQYGSWGKG